MWGGKMKGDEGEKMRDESDHYGVGMKIHHRYL